MDIQGGVLLRRFQSLEAQWQGDLAEQRRRFRYRIEHGRVRFEREAALWQRRFRQSLPAYIRQADPLTVLSSPVIFSVAAPLAALDLWASAYQWLCFPIYGIEEVRRADYFLIDRHFLSYLNPVEKLGCVYCSYANGLMGYLREISARTEEHFCPIKHARRVLSPHSRYHAFLEYGDAAAYRRAVDSRSRNVARQLAGPARARARRRRHGGHG